MGTGTNMSGKPTYTFKLTRTHRTEQKLSHRDFRNLDIETQEMIAMKPHARPLRVAGAARTVVHFTVQPR